MDPSDPMLGEFRSESLSQLDIVEAVLLELDQCPEDVGIHIDAAFRAIHSVKGNAGFFGFHGVIQISHAAESLLDAIRTGQRSYEASIGDLLLRAVDVLRQQLDDPASDVLDPGLVTALHEARCMPAQSAPSEQELLLEVDLDQLRRHIECEHGIIDGLSKVGVLTAAEPAPARDLDHGSGKARITLRTPLPPAMVAELYGLDEDAVLVAHEADITPAASAPEPITAAAKAPAGAPPAKAPTGRAASAPATSTGRNGNEEGPEPTVRVGTRFLDDLLAFTGNMVMARNQLLTRFPHFQEDLSFTTLSRCITDVHRSVVQQRMVSIGSLFERFRRIIRDLARSLDKQADLHIAGGEMELDRSIIEAFSDPLTHLVRNAIDHAIETPAARTAAGKTPRGQITLRAAHQSGELIIEVEDDGAGIDRQRILDKALSLGLVESQAAEQLSEQAIIDLIFTPGFSTRDQASDVSGRGVGMDVVKHNIERIGGVIEMRSDRGRGTCFTFRLPHAQSIVSSSLISALVVHAGGQRFALPESAVNEIIRVDPREQDDRIRSLEGSDVYQLRDKVLSIVHLEDALGLGRTFFHPQTHELLPDRRQRIPDRRQNEDPDVSARWAEQRSGSDRRLTKQTLVVVEFRRSLFGLIVDKVDGIEEVVVRESPALVAQSPVFGGHTVLGDSSLVMMCDIAGIVETMGLHFGNHEPDRFDTRGALKTAQQMVVFSNAPGEYFAMPLMMTSLIERISAADLRTVGSREYYQLKDHTIPILRLEDHLDVSTHRATHHHLIIPARLQHPIGLLVGSELTVEDSADHFDPAVEAGPGVLGTTYRDGRLTMLLDLYALCEHALPEQFIGQRQALHRRARILLAEDNRFFARLVSTYITTPQIDLLLAEDGAAAWELLQTDEAIDLVISDIEMPRMNGFELVRRIRNDSRLRDMPVIALTSLADEESRARGMQAGFDHYAVKIDKQELLRLLDETLAGYLTQTGS